MNMLLILCVHNIGGLFMRTPFRTTIDEEILNWLKMESKMQGVPVNRIIEQLVSDEAGAQRYVENVKKYDSLSYDQKEEFLRRRLEIAIDSFFCVYRLYVPSGDFYEEVTLALTRVAQRNKSKRAK